MSDQQEKAPQPVKKRKLSDAQWDAIRTLSHSGVTDEVISEAYGIPVQSISAKRGHDPSWREAYKVVMKGLKLVQTAEMQENAPTNEDVNLMKKVLESNLHTLDQENRILAATVGANMLKKGILKDFEPESFQDMKHATDIVAKAGAWGNAPVVVNVSAYSEMQEVGPTHEMETEEVDEREAYFRGA